MNESLNPEWNQTFDFVIEDGLHDMLIVEVWDHDTFGKVKIPARYIHLPSRVNKKIDTRGPGSLLGMNEK